MRKRTMLVLFLLLFGYAVADEGMWLLTQLNQLELQKKGLQIPVSEIYNPDGTGLTDAVVWLGGCTSSFVSANGLLVTNHHCAYGALQRASTMGTVNYIEEGFQAGSYEEELPAPGQSAFVLLGLTDVTDEVLKNVKGENDPVKRADKLEKAIAKMVETEEGGKSDISVRIVPMFQGRKYHKYVYRRYDDVRIVFAPPVSVGKYGGEIDNWMWPRHTGDFTFMRVYSAPDGSGAAFNKENVPVQPKNYLRIAGSDLKEGDFTFILGFPGNTTRYRTSFSVEHNLNFVYPNTIKDFQDIINIMDKLAEQDPAAEIKMAGMKAGLANTMKNFQGKVDGMTKTDFIARKKAFEQELSAFINSDKKLKKEFGEVLPKISAEYNSLNASRELDDALNSFGRLSGSMLGLANTIFTTVDELAKPEKDREPGFSMNQVTRTKDRLKFTFASYYEPFDMAVFERTLNKPGVQNLEAVKSVLNGRDIKSFVAEAYASTQLKNPEFAQSLFEKTPADLKALNDPFMNLVIALQPQRKISRERNEKFAATIDLLRQKYIEALLAWKGESGMYPDANGTIRFTYGEVAGYEPADAVVYEPFTSLAGVVEKNTGAEPFNAPQKLIDLSHSKNFGRWTDPELNDVPVAFTHRCDITGGNSGSPVMNAKGELIGLAFDGNYEAMTGDWQYDYEIQRTISVDIRYVLFIVEKFGGAAHLLKEMNL